MSSSFGGRETGVVCPHCNQRIDVQPGGWAFVYSQLLTHLDRCAAELTEQERRTMAEKALEQR
jgi:hypothetical protein